MVLPADMTTSAAAPSLMDDEFAAVTVPSAGLNAGFSFVILSIFTCMHRDIHTYIHTHTHTHTHTHA